MPLPKAPSWAVEFAQFIEDSQKVPYESLVQHFSDSQWKYRLVQRSAVPTPGDHTLVDTDILIGPSVDKLDFFDTVTVKIDKNLIAPTWITRQNILISLIGTVFGRFPPPAVQQPTEAAPAAANGIEVQPGHTGDILLPGEGGEYVEDAAPAVNVVARREPDGLPIFVDLYELGAKTNDVLDAVLDEMRAFLKMATSIEQVDAVAAKNPDMVAFVKDLGDQVDRSELKTMVEQRRAQLTIPAAAAAAERAPRRRTRAPQTN